MNISGNTFFRRFNIKNKINNYLESLSTTKVINLKIPTEVYYRTELMCECIASDIGTSWGVVHFIFYIYQSFIKDAVENYDPKKVLKIISSYHKYFQKTLFKVEELEFTYSKFDSKMSEITIKIDKEEVKKGELILYEIKELFGYDLKFDEFLSYLWIDYIEEYKKGNNQKAYKTLYRLVKEDFNI